MIPTTLSVALIQMDSGADRDQNLSKALHSCEIAFSNGAEFVLFPETFLYRGPHPEGENLKGPAILAFEALAKHYQGWILTGSIHEQTSHHKFYNTSCLIGPSGLISSYRKMHLFNAKVGHTQLEESLTFERGDRPVLAPVKGISVGLSICYDLRFPELYQWYAFHGASIMCIPSSFTTLTGRAHWESLIRARAIETQSFVLAPNQVGLGARGVPTYGNSLIVDPFGKILACASETESTILYATLDLKELVQTRRSLPITDHHHPYFE